MKDFFRQNGVLLLGIALLLTIILGVGSLFLGGYEDPLSSVVQVITTPVRSGVSALLDWAEGVWNYVFRYQEMQEQIDQLETELAQMQEQVRQAQQALQENEQYRELLELKSRRRELHLETARVTAHSTSNWESTVTINRGSLDDVEPGDCVITSSGVLVGVVSEVSPNSATVSTVINTATEIGGIVRRTWSAGVLEGDFALMQQGRLRMSYLPENAQMVAGDEVVTSGVGDVYPSDLVVGVVQGVYNEASGMTRYAIITPSADLGSLSEVAVIRDFDIVE